MIIERTNSEIIIRLPGNLNVDELQDLKDWFEFLEATQNTKANQEDVDVHVKSIKKGRWNKRKIDLMK